MVDAGDPRNAPAAHMHGYLGSEGLPPSELAAIGREEVRSYGGEVLAGRAIDVTRTADDRFRVDLVGGHSIVARRVLAATGLVDVLPDIEGVTQHWGRDVIHCPFCHGFEVRDRRVVQIITHPMGLHPAALFRQLTPNLTVVLHEVADVDATASSMRCGRAASMSSTDRSAASSRATTGMSPPSNSATGVGSTPTPSSSDPRFAVRIEPFVSIGLTAADHPMGLGDFVETDMTGETSVPGLYAAGNVTDPSQQVLHAAANGSRVGAMISFSLAAEDLQAAARPSANQADWDRRYGGEQIWSGNPNGSLVNEIGDAAPGRALDVGAGEGGDACWLAAQGWTVTASDVSQRGLERVAAAADGSWNPGRDVARRRERIRAVRATVPSISCRRSTRRSPAPPTGAACATCSAPSPPAARCSWSATTSNRCGCRSTPASTAVCSIPTRSCVWRTS